MCTTESRCENGYIERSSPDSLYYSSSETKMYRDLKQKFWWKRMKVDIAKYVAACGVCQQVKAEHKRPAGLMQPLEIPEWKWEHITMDFIVGLPRSPRGRDAFWVFVEK